MVPSWWQLFFWVYHLTQTPKSIVELMLLYQSKRVCNFRLTKCCVDPCVHITFGCEKIFPSTADKTTHFSLYHALGNFALTLAQDRLEDTLHFHMQKFARSPPKCGLMFLVLRSQLRQCNYRPSKRKPWKETHSMHTHLIDSTNMKVHRWNPVYLFGVSRCVRDLLKYSQWRLL